MVPIKNQWIAISRQMAKFIIELLLTKGKFTAILGFCTQPKNYYSPAILFTWYMDTQGAINTFLINLIALVMPNLRLNYRIAKMLSLQGVFDFW